MRNLLVPFGLKPKKVIDPNAPRYGDVYARGVAACIDVMLVFMLFEWLFTRINQHLLMGLDREKLGQIDPATGITAVITTMHEAHFFSYWRHPLYCRAVDVPYDAGQVAAWLENRTTQ